MYTFEKKLYDIVAYRQLSLNVNVAIIVVDVFNQIKWLVRKKLAPCLRMKVPSKPSVVCIKDNNDAGDFQQDGQQLQAMTAAGRMNKLLMEIQRDLQQTRDGDKSDEEDEDNKNDWKLAAAVFDRFLLIIFSILLVGGSAIFFVVFAVGHHNPDD